MIAAVRTGELDEAILDTAVVRVLELVERATATAAPRPELDVDGHHALARAAATECAVLLKNDGILPLRPADGETVAVIGEFAGTPRYQGAGSSQVNPTASMSPWTSCVQRSGPVSTSRSPPDTASVPPMVMRNWPPRRSSWPVGPPVVVFLGLPAADESEGYDRTNIDLPDNQTLLLARLAAANPNLVVVLANGSVVRASNWEQHPRAILECWLSGQAAGGAFADLLLGAANPSGRLAETLPQKLDDNSSYLNFPGEAGHVQYGERIFVGYRGYDALNVPVGYPFGHGLSYTTFEYSDLDVSGAARAGDRQVPGHQYRRPTWQGSSSAHVGDPQASVARPVRELKAFTKVDRDPVIGRKSSSTLDRT